MRGDARIATEIRRFAQAVRVNGAFAARRGFTLVELLVVIAIIGILVAMLLPAVQSAREAARRMQCSNNLKQLALAMHNFHTAKGSFPAGGHDAPSYLGWTVTVLPYIEQQNLFDKFDLKQSYNSATNKPRCAHLVPAYACPSQSQTRSQLKADYNVDDELISGQSAYTTHYYGVAGPKGTNPVGGTYPLTHAGTVGGGFAEGGVLYRESRVRIDDVKDGTTNTLLLGELSWSDAHIFRIWNRGCDQASNQWCSSCKNVHSAIGVQVYSAWAVEFNDVSFGSDHPGGAHFAYGDGSVHFLSESLDLATYKSLASRQGREVVTVP